jgi:nitroimidazol reductase NimA-like FMN-containing flavoprotein (pyridoxamine 5'-phosphate oxidase superfamily)
MTPRSTLLRLPAGYGTPTRLLDWADVERRLAASEHYWVATTGPGGRPHTVPVDGLWVGGRWYWGGAPDAAHQRNATTTPHAAVTLPDTTSVVIVEGDVEQVSLSSEEARELADASNAKYPQYGATPESYAGVVVRVVPVVAYAWTAFPIDCTRFTFAGATSDPADNVGPT